MRTAVVVGGGPTGLAAALALRPLGYRVEVLDRDPGPVPESVAAANAGWVRPSSPQALHSHSFTSLAVFRLREHAPEVYAALLSAGSPELDLADGALPFLACRRRTFDQVFATASGVEVRRGTKVSGLVIDGSRVAGVRLSGGGRVDADVVVDASGRRCESRRWLADAGLPVAPDRTSPSGISCYTRFYRSLDGSLPGALNLGTAAGGAFGTYLAFVHPGDNGTFSVGVGVLPEDRVLHSVHRGPVFDAVVGATPLASWIDPAVAEPISRVHAITFPDNTARGVAGSAQAPVAGLFPVGDAACVTNPLYGRGVALGIAHAFRLPEVLDEPGAAAALVEDLLFPWYDRAVIDDLDRNRRWRQAVLGEDAPPVEHLSFGHATLASTRDPVLWRRLAAVRMSLGHPEEFYADPDTRARVGAALAQGVPPPAGPSRSALVELVGEAA
ncbi:NAD(P)/FAD-dependent oxidoreductase [Actinokineospora sp. 24-640]